MEKFIALLPMKGHSERVPKKNLRNFNTKPLYHHVMNTLLNCKNIKEVVVDTDCPDIMKDIKENFPQVTVLEREMSLRGDMVSMNLIIGDIISKVNGDLFIQTHSTNPLLKSDTIDEALELLLNNKEKHDSVFAVTELKTRLYDHEGTPINHDPTKLERTQDLKSIYEENSNFYIFTREAYGKRNCRIGENPAMFKVSKLESLDIDYEEDFIIAEAVSKAGL